MTYYIKAIYSEEYEKISQEIFNALQKETDIIIICDYQTIDSIFYHIEWNPLTVFSISQ